MTDVPGGDTVSVMADPAGRIPSFDELYDAIRRLPEGVTGEILEPGVLHTMSRPGRAHRFAAKACAASLGPADADVGGIGWWIEQEAEVRFSLDRLAVPDLAGGRIQRVSRLPDENPLTILPDWCCEILSPSTARDDKRLKLPLYAASRVGWIWMIDPALRLLEVYETIGGLPALKHTAKDDDRVVLPPFDFEIALGRFWLPDAAAL